MCQVSLVALGCGHKIFNRLLAPCPAGICSRHNKCQQGRTRVTRIYRTHLPPFCRKCYEQQRGRIEQESFEAQNSFLRNHVAVRNYFVARYGVATTEDRDGVGNRLLKRERAQQEDLDRAFFTGMAHGASAYLWERRSLWRTRRSREDHERFCISSYMVDYNWNSSDDEDIVTDPSSNQRYRFPEEDMRRSHGAMPCIDSQGRLQANDDQSEASEAGDYFPDYQREQLERIRIRRGVDRVVNNDYASLLESDSELSSGDDQLSTRAHHIHRTGGNQVSSFSGLVQLRVPSPWQNNSLEASQGLMEEAEASGGYRLPESVEYSQPAADNSTPAERNQERGIQVSVTELPNTPPDGMGESTPIISTPPESSRESPTGEVVNSPLVRLIMLERRTVLEEPVSVDEILRDGIRGAARRYPWRLGAHRHR
ncbi:MAG: hypothetical protein Q9201_003697 [Fulgogasparrea decipioides]